MDYGIIVTFRLEKSSVDHLEQAPALKSGLTSKLVFNRLLWEILALPVLHERTLLHRWLLHIVDKAVFGNNSDLVGSPLTGLSDHEAIYSITTKK